MIAATARDLRFAYGEARRSALDGVDLDVEAGEIVLLEGPSGEGKSTLLRALCGLVPHFHGGRFAGRVTVGGIDTVRGDRARVFRMAGMVFQDPEGQAVLGAVDRDVAFGLECAGVAPAEIPGRVRGALAAAGAAHLEGRTIASLSGGERQRVAIAGVLAPAPRVLLLDEPTSQLDDAGSAALMATLRDLADAGTAVVMSEHRGDRARATADRVVAVRDGRLARAQEPSSAPRRRPSPAPGEVRARLEAVVAGHAERTVVRDAWLDLRAGEVTTIQGANGSGKSTLLRVLAGLHTPGAGRVVLEGRDVTELPTERRFPALGLVGQDPGRHLLTERVDTEVGFALRGLRLSRAKRAERVAEALEALELGPLSGRHPLDLSVGQRERVAIAAILAARPGVIALDEPTRGMDPQRKETLAALLRTRAAEGAAVVVATHDADFARRVGDRALAMSDGAPRELPVVVSAEVA